MERHFDIELNLLKQKLLEMGALAETMIGDSLRVFTQRDSNLAEAVFKKEELVNKMHIEIDEICLKLIALHQPTASDLRFLMAASKINSELERLGDQAINICQNSLWMLNEPLVKPLIDIPKMAEIASRMVKESLDALVNSDAEKARNVLEQDDQVDELRDKVFKELIEIMIKDSTTVARSLDMILIARNLERIGDHATNIAEDVIFMIQGMDIRHHAEER